LEKYYCAPEAKYYLRPPHVKSGTGDRIGQNSFPNTGASLIYGHTEIASDLGALPPNLNLTSYSLQEVFNMLTSDQLDSTAVAHLSHALRHQNLLVINENI
jgi:hypothetical protein